MCICKCNCIYSYVYVGGYVYGGSDQERDGLDARLGDERLRRRRGALHHRCTVRYVRDRLVRLPRHDFTKMYCRLFIVVYCRLVYYRETDLLQCTTAAPSATYATVSFAC